MQNTFIIHGIEKLRNILNRVIKSMHNSVLKKISIDNFQIRQILSIRTDMHSLQFLRVGLTTYLIGQLKFSLAVFYFIFGLFFFVYSDFVFSSTTLKSWYFTHQIQSTTNRNLEFIQLRHIFEKCGNMSF